MEEELASSGKILNANKTESVSIKHYNRLITELRCPGCASPMKAPILQCLSGHSICETCTKILPLCPICENGFSNIRSLTVEALCAKAYFTCSYAINGCKARLPTKLLDWHEQQCAYKTVKCFMGKVWGDCTFSCREIDWKEHIESQHKDKVFNSIPIELTWDLNKSPGPLVAYYVIHAFDEMFYLYQIYDQSVNQVLWSVTCISHQQEKISKFAFEIEIYNPTDTSQILCQRFPCHSEHDKDILQEGTCVSVSMIDILRFVNDNKVLSYKVNIHEVDIIRKKSSLKREAKTLPKDFTLTSVEGVNHKFVPTENIITRKLSTTLENSSTENVQNLSDDSDAEIEMFVNQLISSTPKLNFNQKFVTSKINLKGDILKDQEDEMTSLIKYQSVSDLRSSKKFNPIGRIAKSFMNLKIDLPDLRNIRKDKNNKK